MSSLKEAGPIVFFDGLCRFCDGSVRFVIRRDPKRVFRFAPLQSAFAAQALQGLTQAGSPDLSTMVLLENGTVYLRSDAALRIAARLRAPWSWLRVLLWVPRPVRDGIYRFIAAHRYRWFGKKQHCQIPAAQDRERFVG